VVDSEDTPHTRLRGVTSILSHVTAILYCDVKNRITHEHVIATFQVMMEGCLVRYPYSSQLRVAEGLPTVTVVAADDSSNSTLKRLLK